MPKFVARLEAQDGSGHFRRVTGIFDTEQEFRDLLESRENGYAAYRLDTEELADLEAREAALEEGQKLSALERSKLALHRQADPYVLVSIDEEEVA